MSADDAAGGALATDAAGAARVAVVTGASSGIGAATARRLAREPGMHVVLLARRAERLEALVDELGPASTSALALDLLAEDAPARVRERLAAEHGGRLDLLVNNAGAGRRGTFADAGYAAVRATFALNFDAQLRLTEALLPLLRASAPSAIVNVTSTAARLSRPGVGAYSASKAAFALWSDALAAEERQHGVHVGMVLPGFIATEGFPQTELVARRRTRWLLGTPAAVAEAIADVGLRGRPERWSPRYYGAIAALRSVAPGLVRRVVASGRADVLTRRVEGRPEG